MSLKFVMEIEAFDVFEDLAVLAFSSLGGNNWNGAIKVLNIKTGQEICSQASNTGITAVKFLNKNSDQRQRQRLIACARDDGYIGIYSNDLTNVAFLDAHNDIASSIALSSSQSSNHFYSSGWDGNICLWDSNIIDTTTTSPIQKIIGAHSSAITAISTSGEMKLASVGMDGFLRLWDFRESTHSHNGNCSQIFNLRQASSCVHFDQCNEYSVIAGTDAGDILGFDMRFSTVGKDKNTMLFTIPAHRLRVRKVLTSSQRPGMLLSCADDCSISLHNITNANINADDNVGPSYVELKRISTHSDYVSDLAWLPDSDSSSNSEDQDIN